MNTADSNTPVMLALTRRALVFGLPYNTFISWLIAGCVTLIWVDSIGVVAALLVGSYIFCSILCHRDIWALDIFLMRLQQLGVCPIAVKKYFQLRSYAPE